MRSVAKYRAARPSLFVSLLFFVLVAGVTGVRGLKNASVEIPAAVAAGSTVNMNCKYDLESDTLYTVKWYYRNHEFFRYVPKEDPAIEIFGDVGAKIATNRSGANNVIMMDVQPNNSGKYTCEVSADFPFFTTLADFGYMQVASLPKGDPEVNVEKLRYAVGDTVRSNCTVPSGNPPANITWTVNGNQVNSSFVMNITDKFVANHHVAIAGLDFEITPNSFNNGKLHVVCHASVFRLYQEKAEVVLMEERPILASVLGTRESSYIGNAAKRVEEWFYIVLLVTLLLCTLR